MKLTTAIGVLALAASLPYLSIAQTTGTMVDPSVPAGVAPNPSSLESARPAGPAPTSVPKLSHKDDLPKANPKLREKAPGLVPPRPGATPSVIHAPTATPNR